MRRAGIIQDEQFGTLNPMVTGQVWIARLPLFPLNLMVNILFTLLAQAPYRMSPQHPLHLAALPVERATQNRQHLLIPTP
jgi:hypothetical protein